VFLGVRNFQNEIENTFPMNKKRPAKTSIACGRIFAKVHEKFASTSIFSSLEEKKIPTKDNTSPSKNNFFMNII
jgi:hypothetical protein